jgi:hypothetical protein
MWGQTDEAERNTLFWRALLSGLAIVCLVLTLANRVLHLPNTGLHTVRSTTLNSKIEHRDVVAYCWSAPVTSFSFPPACAVSYRIVWEAEPFLPLKLDGCRYNRPPPISATVASLTKNAAGPMPPRGILGGSCPADSLE